MQVIRLRREDRARSDDHVYNGVVRRQTVVPWGPHPTQGPLPLGTFRILEVTFEGGARTKLHAHTTDQVLVITAGRGIVGTREHRYEVAPGDIVHTPAAEPHFHGAALGTDMTHLAFIGATSETKILE